MTERKFTVTNLDEVVGLQEWEIVGRAREALGCNNYPGPECPGQFTVEGSHRSRLVIICHNGPERGFRNQPYPLCYAYNHQEAEAKRQGKRKSGLVI